MVGVDRINKWATLLGLGEKSGIDLPNEVQGLVPSTEWKQRADRREVVRRARRSRSSIGQGQVSVTPVSMAVYIATLANGGTRVTPHLLKAVDDGSGWKPVPRAAAAVAGGVQAGDASRRIHDGLWMVVNGAGTGGRARIAGRDVSGQDRHGAGHLARKAARRPGQDRQGPARPRLVRVLRAARQPGDCRRRVRRARRARRNVGRADRASTCSRRSSRRRTARRCRRRPSRSGRRRRPSTATIRRWCCRVASRTNPSAGGQPRP